MHIYLDMIALSYLTQVGQGLLAQAMGVANIGEDDDLASFDTFGSRQVDLAANRILALLHALRDRVVGKHLTSARI